MQMCLFESDTCISHDTYKTQTTFSKGGFLADDCCLVSVLVCNDASTCDQFIYDSGRVYASPVARILHVVNLPYKVYIHNGCMVLL